MPTTQRKLDQDVRRRHVNKLSRDWIGRRIPFTVRMVDTDTDEDCPHYNTSPKLRDGFSPRITASSEIARIERPAMTTNELSLACRKILLARALVDKPAVAPKIKLLPVQSSPWDVLCLFRPMPLLLCPAVRAIGRQSLPCATDGVGCGPAVNSDICTASFVTTS